MTTNHDAMLGVKFTVGLRARAVQKERWFPVCARARAGPAVWHAGVGPLAACDSASFDPQQAGAPFCFDGVTSYA